MGVPPAVELTQTFEAGEIVLIEPPHADETVQTSRKDLSVFGAVLVFNCTVALEEQCKSHATA